MSRPALVVALLVTASLVIVAPALGAAVGAVLGAWVWSRGERVGCLIAGVAVLAAFLVGIVTGHILDVPTF